MKSERVILRVLTEFNFHLVSNEDLMNALVDFCLESNSATAVDISNLGWREKVLWAFCCAVREDRKCVGQMKSRLLSEVTGRQIKAYLVALFCLENRNKIARILSEYIERFAKDSREIGWVMAMEELLSNNQNDLSKKAKKLKEAICIVNEVRRLSR